MLSLFGPDPSHQGLDDVEFGFQFEQHHQHQNGGGGRLFSFGDEYNENHIFRSDSEDRDADDEEEEEARDRENMFTNIEDLLVDTERKLQQSGDTDGGMVVEVTSCTIDATQQPTEEPRGEAIVLGFENEPLTEQEYRLELMVHLMVRRDERLEERVRHHQELAARQASEMNAFTQEMDPRIVKRATVREVLDTVREKQLRDLSSDDLQLLIGHLNAGHLWSLVSTHQWSLCHTCYQNYLILTIGPIYHIIRDRHAVI